MSRRRIASLLRLRHARMMLRNAAGSRLAEAEGIVTAAEAWQRETRRVADELRSGAVKRFRAATLVSALLEYDREREGQASIVAQADAAHVEAEKYVQEARQALARCEQEVRRVERALENALRERRTMEHKAEQVAHDDLTNAKRYGDAVAAIEEEP